MTRRERDKQLNKEAIATLVLYLAFFVWWYVTGYGLGLKDPSEYTYIIGLPSWFFYSCVAGWILVTGGVYLLIKYVFVEIDFDEENLDSNES